MPMFTEQDRQKVAQLVRVLTNCSSSDADKAGDAICRDPESIALLGAACGLTANIAVEAATATEAAAVIQAWPLALGAAVWTGANVLAAKRFCTALVKQTASQVSASVYESDKFFLRSSVGE